MKILGLPWYAVALAIGVYFYTRKPAAVPAGSGGQYVLSPSET